MKTLAEAFLNARLSRWTLAGTLLFFLATIPGFALENGLARTPPMGWNSWNKFGCDVSEGSSKAPLTP
jgi:hypothetical protein